MKLCHAPPLSLQATPTQIQKRRPHSGLWVKTDLLLSLPAVTSWASVAGFSLGPSFPLTMAQGRVTTDTTVGAHTEQSAADGLFPHPLSEGSSPTPAPAYPLGCGERLVVVSE